MSDEFDFDEETPVVDAEGEQVQPAPPEQQVFKVGVVGSNKLAEATYIAFDTLGIERMMVTGDGDVDDLIAWKPTLTFVCTDIPLRKNDTLDDTEILGIVTRLIHQAQSGICVRSTLNIETIQRMIMAVQPEAFEAKVAYMPDFSDGDDIGEMLVCDYQAIGANEKVVEPLMNILKHTSHFSAQQIATGTVFEIAFAKLAVSGFKAVKQTYFNQLHDTILDVKNANPTIVRRLIENHPTMTDKTVMVPTYIRGKTEGVSHKQARAFGGEFLNDEVRQLVGMTDKIPLLDECINYKNLKG